MIVKMDWVPELGEDPPFFKDASDKVLLKMDRESWELIEHSRVINVTIEKAT